jgi:predicted kinase
VAEGLRDRLALPLLAKDTLKERLADVFGTEGRVESQRLGVAVFELLALVGHELLGAGVSTIVEGNFTMASPLFVALPPARIVVVHVTASPETLRSRLRERAGRHPVHYDAEAADEIAERARSGEWAPVEIGCVLITVDTTEAWADLDDVARQIVSLSETGVPSAEG